MCDDLLKILYQGGLFSVCTWQRPKCQKYMVKREPSPRDLMPDEVLLPPDPITALHEELISEDAFCERVKIEKKDLLAHLVEKGRVFNF